MERTTARVNVAAVGGNAHRDYVRGKRAKQFRAQLVGSAVRAVENDTKAAQLRPRNPFVPEKLQVFRVKRFVSREPQRVFRRWIAPMLEDVGLELLLNRVREFHARVRKKLHAVVLKRVVGGGDDHACLKIVLAYQASDARRGDDSCKGNRCAGLREPRGEKRGNVRAG